MAPDLAENGTSLILKLERGGANIRSSWRSAAQREVDVGDGTEDISGWLEWHSIKQRMVRLAWKKAGDG